MSEDFHSLERSFQSDPFGSFLPQACFSDFQGNPSRRSSHHATQLYLLCILFISFSITGQASSA